MPPLPWGVLLWHRPWRQQSKQRILTDLDQRECTPLFVGSQLYNQYRYPACYRDTQFIDFVGGREGGREGGPEQSAKPLPMPNGKNFSVSIF